MALQGPNTEDIKKIHTEVNQIVNQRLSITTLAVTVFAATMAWLIPKSPLSPGSDVGTFIYTASILITVVLFALFLLTHLLTQMLRIFTAYLDVTDTSSWEKDWVAYRDRFSYLGYTRPQTLIFLLLGVVSAGFPFLLRAAYPIRLEPRAGAILCAVIGGLYVALVSGMGLARWGAKEDKLRRRWKELKDR
jgi:hypothetical protein